MSEEDQKDEEIVYQHLCRLCNYYRDDRELYDWVRSLTMKGIPYGRVRTLFEQHLNQHYPDIKVPTKKSIWNHFNKHINVKESAKLELARQEYVSDGDPNDMLVSNESIRELAKGNFDEYVELCGLYVKFRDVHDRIYKLTGSLQTSSADNSMSVWSQNRINTYVSMVNTQKGILTEISKMRQSNKLLSVATQFIVETYTKNIVTKLGSEFTALVSVMKRQGVSSEIIETLEDITSHRLANILISEAEIAMSQTKSEFKLPN